MSLLVRPTVIFAIIFGCFAALVPRILIPFLRPRSAPSDPHDNFRRSPPASVAMGESQSPNDPHIHAPFSGLDPLEPITIEPTGTKTMGSFALPMYAVGIVVFFLYTCFKYCSKRNHQELKLQQRYSTRNIRWNSEKHRFNYDINSRLVDENEDECHEDDQYAGLDPDYVQYLKSKRQKEVEDEQKITVEEKQMNYTLDEMKSSLSFINTKLAVKDNKGNLSHNEISQLQQRLASTEAQMYQLLNALDVASNKVQELTKNTRESLQESEQPQSDDEGGHLLSRSASESEDEEDDENSLSDGDDQVPVDAKLDEESSSSISDEEEDEISHESNEENDDQSESSSGRYGLMESNYTCDSEMVDDYELNPTEPVDSEENSRTKVQEWRERHQSQSLSSNESSVPEDQSIPTTIHTEESSQ